MHRLENWLLLGSGVFVGMLGGEHIIDGDGTQQVAAYNTGEQRLAQSS